MFNTSLLTVPNILIIGAFTVLAIIVSNFVLAKAGVVSE